MSSPRISVVLPVYNAVSFLQMALESVLTQSFSDFEVIAIDDGSTDGSVGVLEHCQDPRLKLIRHHSNRGLISTLNEGLDLAQGEYIARMDSDDVCDVDRFLHQINFLDHNPSVGIVGTFAQRVDIHGARIGLTTPSTDPERIRCDLLFNSALVHPSVMMRTSVLRDNDLQYRGFKHCEDLELWRRAAEVTSIANIPMPLLFYRVHAASVTGDPVNQADSKAAMERTDQLVLRQLGVNPSQDQLNLHYQLRLGGIKNLDCVESWLLQLLEANGKAGVYPDKIFAQTVATKWYFACHTANGWGALKWQRLMNSELACGLDLNITQSLKFLLRVR